jgi:hypothetical protein
MSDESTNDQVPPEPVKQVRKRAKARHKVNGAASRTDGSYHPPDAPWNGNTPSKSDSPPTNLQKKSKDANASDDTFVVKVDPSTKAVTFSSNLPIFGTKNDDSNGALVNQVCNIVTDVHGERSVENLKFALPLIKGIGPKDELEGLLAVQMIGVHNLAMQCLERVSRKGQTPFIIDANVNLATKLLRTFTMQMEALNRHRGKIGHQMVVGNVNVNEGGQAIVGPVSKDGRGTAPREDDPRKVK